MWKRARTHCPARKARCRSPSKRVEPASRKTRKGRNRPEQPCCRFRSRPPKPACSQRTTSQFRPPPASAMHDPFRRKQRRLAMLFPIRTRPEGHARLQGRDACLDAAGIELTGVQHDPALLLPARPTYSSHALSEVALRRFNLKLSGNTGGIRRHDRAPGCSPAQRSRKAGVPKLYEEIDLPLVPVLARMEAGGRKDRHGSSSSRCRRGWKAKSTPRRARSTSDAGWSSTSIRPGNWATYCSTS